MHPTFDLASITALRERLDHHPLYTSMRTLDDVRNFMAHHVYSVWDFMSLLKYLQHRLAPASFPWVPIGSPSVRRFINEITLEEESDEGLPGANGSKAYASHFELYCEAMREIRANADVPLSFVAMVRRDGLETALARSAVPEPARRFMRTTFSFIATDKPHVVAAAVALGREQVIPGMFRALLQEMQISPRQAPAFHYYLERHIHLDQDHHGPLSLLVLDELCEGDPAKLTEAKEAAALALSARMEFWGGVQQALVRNRAGLSA